VGAGIAAVAVPATAATALSRAEIEALITERVSALLAQSRSPEPLVLGGGGTASSAGTADTEPPVITISGNNPAMIGVGGTYADLGASVTDNVDQNIGIHTLVDGVEMVAVQIDTSAAGTHTIEYKATDQAGNVGAATRAVEVADPASAPVVPPPDETTPPPASPEGSAATSTEAIANP
jgi:hypothetical protein